MTVPVLAFFNNKSGVGKTSLVYHLAWMLSDMEYRVLGAIGSHAAAANDARRDFRDLAKKIVQRINLGEVER